MIIENFNKYKNVNNLTIEYGKIDCIYGSSFIATIEDQICFLGFYNHNNIKTSPEVFFKNIFNKINPQEDLTIINKLYSNIFVNPQNTKILLKGTNFQIRVWKELANIPCGTTITYQEIAENLGNKNMVRAVANAIANNPVSFLIPCHRVVYKNQSTKQAYLWGADLKEKILATEKSTNQIHIHI